MIGPVLGSGYDMMYLEGAVSSAILAGFFVPFVDVEHNLGPDMRFHSPELRIFDNLWGVDLHRGSYDWSMILFQRNFPIVLCQTYQPRQICSMACFAVWAIVPLSRSTRWPRLVLSVRTYLSHLPPTFIGIPLWSSKDAEVRSIVSTFKTLLRSKMSDRQQTMARPIPEIPMTAQLQRLLPPFQLVS